MNKTGIRDIARDTVIGLFSGYAGIKVMDPVTTKFQEMETEEDKRREKEVSQSVAYDVAARKVARSIGLQLSDEQVPKVGMILHYGLGLWAGPLYMWLRRTTSLSPMSSAVVVAMMIFLGVDEGLNYALGFSAPPGDYPVATHVRGLVGHLALGVTTAVAAESLAWVLRCPLGSEK